MKLGQDEINLIVEALLDDYNRYHNLADSLPASVRQLLNDRARAFMALALKLREQTP